MKIANIILCVWLAIGILALCFVVYNEIRRERKLKVGLRFLEKYCMRDVLYTVTPTSDKNYYQVRDVFYIQLMELRCDLNLSLHVCGYLVIGNHISKTSLALRDIYRLFASGDYETKVYVK